MRADSSGHCAKYGSYSGVTVNAIITDRHPQVQKYLREQKPEVRHFYDVWHVAKGI